MCLLTKYFVVNVAPQISHLSITSPFVFVVLIRKPCLTRMCFVSKILLWKIWLQWKQTNSSPLCLLRMCLFKYDFHGYFILHNSHVYFQSSRATCFNTLCLFKINCVLKKLLQRSQANFFWFECCASCNANSSFVLKLLSHKQQSKSSSVPLFRVCGSLSLYSSSLLMWVCRHKLRNVYATSSCCEQGLHRTVSHHS